MSQHQILAELPRITDRILRNNVGAVLSYAWNGVMGFPTITDHNGNIISFIEALGIPNLMLWTDHPQFFNNYAALAKDVQSLLSAKNNWHFLKSCIAADEITEILHWPNCHAIHMAEDTLQWKPVRHIRPECDIIAIGSQWPVDGRLTEHLDKPDPQLMDMQKIIAPEVLSGLAALWSKIIDGSARTRLERMGKEWVERRIQNEMSDPFRLLMAMKQEHADAIEWLQQNPDVYFRAARQMWAFGKWQRPFYLEYLARRFDVRQVGTCSQQMVPYREQSAVYALGRIAINIPQTHDQEGMSHKPFQIAASGVALAHLNRRGLAECFRLGEEAEAFLTPAEACETIATLLQNDERREAIAAAGRRRVETEHTWSHRLIEMFQIVGLDMNLFRHESKVTDK